MNDIQVVDNFLNDEELIHLKINLNNFKWLYGHSTRENSIKFWVCDLMNNDFLNTRVFSKIQTHFGKKFVIDRLYANGQSYGMDGIYHQDDHRENFYTFLLYISNITHKNVDIVDGHTLFKQDNKITCIEPIFNRGVLFKSDIHHKGMAPSRSSNLLRISVAFKLREIK